MRKFHNPYHIEYQNPTDNKSNKMACFNHLKRIPLRRFIQKIENQPDKTEYRHSLICQHIKKQGVDCYNR